MDAYVFLAANGFVLFSRIVMCCGDCQKQFSCERAVYGRPSSYVCMCVCVRVCLLKKKHVVRRCQSTVKSHLYFLFAVFFPISTFFFILLGYNEYCFMRIEKLFKLLVNLANCHVLFVFCLLLSLDDASLLGDPVFCSTSCTQDEFTGYAYNIITHKLSTSMKWTRTPIMNCVTFFFCSFI